MNNKRESHTMEDGEIEEDAFLLTWGFSFRLVSWKRCWDSVYNIPKKEIKRKNQKRKLKERIKKGNKGRKEKIDEEKSVRKV